MNVTTKLIFGGQITAIRNTWGTAAVETRPTCLILKWKLNARTASTHARAHRESIIVFPAGEDRYVPPCVLADVSALLVMTKNT